MLARQIESTDAAIDRLAYGLPPSGMIPEEESRLWGEKNN